MFKCAIIGVSGGRARGHADAYREITRGRLVAVATRQPEALDAFGDRYQVEQRFIDYREMFEQVRPDVVHVNTPPNVRLEVFKAADAAGIPALIVEKPLAVQWEDFQGIRRFLDRSKLKIAVNHQLHFHPRRAALQRIVQEGELGEVRFIDASSGMNMAYQGTHTLQAIGAFNPLGKPCAVFGQIGGVGGLLANERQHYAPDECLATIAYDNEVQALLRCGSNAPEVVPGGSVNVHKRVAVYGLRGSLEWTMWSWRLTIDGRTDSGEHRYEEEDLLGQAAMTEAMFDWLEDDASVHPLQLERACQDFDTMLAVYASGLSRQSVMLPATAQAELIQRMRAALGDAGTRKRVMEN